MSLIKRIDVPGHFAVRRAIREATARPVIQLDATAGSEIGSAAAKASESKFVEDFSLEHSSSTLSAP